MKKNQEPREIRIRLYADPTHGKCIYIPREDLAICIKGKDVYCLSKQETYPLQKNPYFIQLSVDIATYKKIKKSYNVSELEKIIEAIYNPKLKGFLDNFTKAYGFRENNHKSQ
jgi:hypothetical protein